MVLTDEEQPLLRILSREYETHGKLDDEVHLDFGPLDPEDPRAWQASFKWSIVLMLALMAFTV